MVRRDDHLVSLGATGWYVWRDIGLRSAGFPAADVLTLGSGVDGRVTYEAAVQQTTAAVRAFAGDARFREAVAWQNRKMLPLCLDKVVRGEPRTVKGRNHELAVTSYAQRYCVKNDTIGFFGPVGWATWDTDPASPAVAMSPGDTAVRRRSVYFEQWAIDAVAGTMAEQPAIRPWLTPRLMTANDIEGRLARIPDRPLIVLAELDGALLELIDGHRTVEAIGRALTTAGRGAMTTVDGVWPALVSLRERGLISLDLLGPIEAWPEVTLRDTLARIGDSTVREPALAALGTLVSARDAVAAAAGDAEKVAASMDELEQVFVQLTGATAHRRDGESYAGRTLIYEDTVLNTEVALGPAVLSELAVPLGFLLDSARWLAGRAADVYRELFGEIFDGYVERTGEQVMPLATFIGHTTPFLSYTTRGAVRPHMAALAQELQAKWARILDVRPTTAKLDPHCLADQVAAEFSSSSTAWPTAMHHSPDIMIAAADVAAIAKGDYQFVLGELHVATNTVESRLFVAQHEDPDRLLAAHEADFAGRRVSLVPAREWAFVNSRTGIAVVQSPRSTYWSLRDDAGGAPAPVLPVAALDVHRGDAGRLVVRHRRSDREYDLVDFLGELLSPTIADTFHPVATSPHRPRVAIGKLVICRESWTFPAADIAWAAVKDERERFQQCRRWFEEQGLPPHAFYRLPVEGKPMFVDASSLSLTNLLAKGIRRSAEHSPAAEVTVTEMLPDIGQTWLVGSDGRHYSSELRLVAVHGEDRR